MLVLAAFGGGMAYAFRTLRPLFRERGKINAEVTGRLTEALGGIRIVKSYTAEKREEIVFTKGAHRLFRNIAKSMTGVSASTAGSTVIVGIIGVLMIWLGGRAIVSNEMTARRAGHVHASSSVWSRRRSSRLRRSGRRSPKRLPAWIGFARSSTCRLNWTRMPRARRSCRSSATSAFEDVWFEYNPGQPVLRGVSFVAAAGYDHRARRIQRLRQEHADQPGDGVQSARPGAAS